MAEIELVRLQQATQLANSLWTGTRYQVVSIDSLSLLAAAEISSVSFGASAIVYETCGGLSSRPHTVPVGERPGAVTFGGAVVRNTALYDLYQTALEALNGGDYKGFNIVLYAFDITSPADYFFPLEIIVMEGCQAVTWQPASADANGGSIPIETVTLQPYKTTRISA